MRISAWAIRNPIPVAILVIALTLAGIVSYFVLPVKQRPNVEFPIVSVTVTQNGAAASEVEEQITRPIENALSGISGLRHVQSTVSLGSSSTTATFEIGSDMQKAVDDVRTAVEQARAILPQGIDPPSTRRLDISNAPILTFAVSSARMSTVELSWFVDDTISRTLQAAKGVAQVSRIGGIDREINVLLDADRMNAFGVSAAAVNSALVGFNRDDNGGRADLGGREQTIRVLGSAQTVADLNQMNVPVSANRFVRLSDIATVADGRAEARGFARLNGAPAVAFQVSKTTNSSDVTVEDAVDAAVAQLNGNDRGVKIDKIVSTVTETRASYSATTHVLLEGMVLAAIVVFLFLRNWRATVIAAVAMPLSLVPTFTAMALLGFSLNIITLLGLTLVIGILVDDAIVEIENIEKRIQAGATPYRASLIGADSIGLAVIATTATIVVVFTPVSFMGGQVGPFFREFGLTVAVAVIFSLVIARLVTPLMAAFFLRAVEHGDVEPQQSRLYSRILDWCLRHPWLSTGGGAILFVVSLLLGATLPTGFQPIGDPGNFYLAVQGTAGATPEVMDRAMRRVTRELRANPDVKLVFAQAGSTSGGTPFNGGGGNGVGTGTITVVLKNARSMTTDSFQRSITPMLRSIPDVQISNQGSFGSAGMEIILAGDDFEVLAATQMKLLREMRNLSLVSDPRPSPPPSAPELIVRPDPQAAARLNVSSQAIASAIRIATIGDIDANVAKYSSGRQRVPIRVRLDQASRSDLAAIGSLQVATRDGKSTPLKAVATLSLEAGPGQILRYDRERRVSVQADLNNVTLGQAQAAVYQLPVMKNLPEGVHIAKLGDSEALGELMSGISIAMGSGILMIYFVLVLLFGSFFKPITILSALPLTFFGAFAAIKLAGLPITLPVLIGLLMLLGLAAKNSILLVEFAIVAERGGAGKREAIMDACRQRARPIVMTTVAMAAGMLPTALGVGAGSEFRQPMAVAVIGGLISSTALSLILVPVVYELIDEFEQWLRPRLARFLTPKSPGDDDPFTEQEMGP
ncbi:hydrophobic/amphiphilic exporter-1, HAE1 family [Sphingobium sp. AP50]|uniref:efflux RND transporter permease subunit n=1 Tax=Sphingobium sp. AP50 TaxID=1884369 RepID=UPI0008D04C90|nr:efflux RND transporter permease subunit [Sphingobium sp. AP50]SEK06544.1 hydrophobic/amphiphilic exporter-1, HAE1 family [Sphingobium sp. AP50]